MDVLTGMPLPVVLPLHPRTRARLSAAGLLEALDGVIVAPPLGYLEFMGLLLGARAVLTDSGGVQKEAYLAGVPCVTLRATTEWRETVDAGWNVLVDLDAGRRARGAGARGAGRAAAAVRRRPGRRARRRGAGQDGGMIDETAQDRRRRVARRRTSRVGAYVVIHPGTVIGAGCEIQDGAVLGKPPKLARHSTASAMRRRRRWSIGDGCRRLLPRDRLRRRVAGRRA